MPHSAPLHRRTAVGRNQDIRDRKECCKQSGENSYRIDLNSRCVGTGPRGSQLSGKSGHAKSNAICEENHAKNLEQDTGNFCRTKQPKLSAKAIIQVFGPKTHADLAEPRVANFLAVEAMTLPAALRRRIGPGRRGRAPR